MIFYAEKTEKIPKEEWEGVLLIYVKTDINATEFKSDLIDTYNQCSVISVKTEREQIYIASFYRPHNLYDDNDIEENNRQLCNVMRSLPKPIIITGDFNYSDISWTCMSGSNKSKDFIETVNDLFLSQHIKFATHISGT